MRRVTKENLIAQIDRLCKIKDEQGQLSMNGEYTLQAYKMLLATMEAEPVAWIAQNKNTGEVEIDEPFAKATNPKYWTDAFPVYHHAQPALVVPGDGLIAELLAIAKEAADDADGMAYAEFSDESNRHTTAISDWESRAAMLNQK